MGASVPECADLAGARPAFAGDVAGTAAGKDGLGDGGRDERGCSGDGNEESEEGESGLYEADHSGWCCS